MRDLPERYREAVNTYEPIQYKGLTLFPVTVREYDTFQTARPALDFMQRSLPVRYLSMPLLSAYYALDAENQASGRPSDGLFARALLLLCLALRFREKEKPEERVRAMAEGVFVARDDPSVLKAIRWEQDGEMREVTPVTFQFMRPILAAQNGVELVSDDENPELVEAQRDLAAANAPELDRDVHTLISSLAALSGTGEREVYGWPILKLQRHRAAYERVFSYLIAGLASANGARFKGGNPVPSPFFDRLDRHSGALVSVDSVTGGRPVTVSEGAAAPPDITKLPNI